MTSENYRQLLNAERDSLEMTKEDFDNTLMHFAMLYHKEQLALSGVVKSLKDNYTPTFEQYRNLIYKRKGHNFLNKETQMYMDYEDMETRYKWHLKNL